MGILVETMAICPLGHKLASVSLQKRENFAVWWFIIYIMCKRPRIAPEPFEENRVL
jgi:hypothetical protein